MNRAIASVFVLLSVAMFGAAAARGTPTTISVDEIRPGMKGYGLSVFRGTEPERFDVEVIDVLHEFRPNQALILIRTPHPVLDRARGVGGMSGSPIYLNGRLAGAYSYGWAYGRDPVVGVTPIANMLAELDRPTRPNAFPGSKPLGQAAPKAKRGRPTRAELGGLPPYQGESELTAFSTLRAYAAQTEVHKGPLGPMSAQTPVLLGGLTDSVANTLGAELEKLGLIPTQAGGASRASKPSHEKFVDGGAIGVELARGDIAITSVGTVTYVDGRGRLVAFGHPMLNAGEIGVPTSVARVLHILVSEMRSFKIAESVSSLGTLIQDRQSGIVIDTKREPARIPVRLRIRGVEGAPKTEWNVQVASHRMLTPMITFGIIANAIQATASDVSDVIFRARSKIGVEGHGTVEVEDHGFAPGGPASSQLLASLRLFRVVDAAFGNAFETTRVTSIDLDLDVEFSREVYQLKGASVAREVVDPGETVPVYVRLRRVDQSDVTKVIQLKIPHAAAGKTVKIAIEPGNRVRIERARPRNLNDVIDMAIAGYPATSLVVSLQMPTRGLQFEGHVIDTLPPSALDTLQFVSTSTGGRAFVTKERQELPLGQVVVGATKLQLRVRNVAKDQYRGEP